MPEKLVRNNTEWADKIMSGSPNYFSKLAERQKPEYFWIGCADARVPANVIAGLEPGEVFVHRNVANVVHSADLNLLSALQFAVEQLNIRKIIVCGHLGCGGVHAACDSSHGNGLVDHWIEPIRALRNRHASELNALSDAESHRRLVELNVMDGVEKIARTPILHHAWEQDTPVEIHGMIYSLEDGKLNLLEASSKSSV